MQQPADVGRQLLGLGPGQHHAVIERMQKTVFIDPAFFFHQNAVHQRNLSGRAAKTKQAYAPPDGEGFTKGDIRHQQELFVILKQQYNDFFRE